MITITRTFIILLLMIGLCFAAHPAYALPQTGSQAPDFTLQTMDGDTVTLSSLQGKKVLLDFFATWCPPCREELKEINEIVRDYPQDSYEILCISVDRSVKTVQGFMKKNKYAMTVLFDNNNIAGHYGVSGIPSLFLIDESGAIAWGQAGMQSKETLLELLDLGNV